MPWVGAPVLKIVPASRSTQSGSASVARYCVKSRRVTGLSMRFEIRGNFAADIATIKIIKTRTVKMGKRVGECLLL